MSDDKIIQHPDGGYTFTGRGIDVFRARAVSKALILYSKTGMKINRQYTPKAMMNVATQITGQKFRARDYLGAAQALTTWADNMSQIIVEK